MTAPSPLPAGYRLVDGAPDAVSYCALRAQSGLSPKTEEQARRAMAGSLYMCHIIYSAPSPTDSSQAAQQDSDNDQIVAMGRLIGDGGWYFLIADIATLPAHQRKGLGDTILRRVLDHVRSTALPGAWVTLMADPPGRRLYARHGFRETAPATVGMGLLI